MSDEGAVNEHRDQEAGRHGMCQQVKTLRLFEVDWSHLETVVIAERRPDRAARLPFPGKRAFPLNLIWICLAQGICKRGCSHDRTPLYVIGDIHGQVNPCWKWSWTGSAADGR